MKPVVGHSANPYLPATAIWIYDQIRALKRYRPIVLTQTRQNLDRFPIEPRLISRKYLAHSQNSSAPHSQNTRHVRWL